MVIDLNLFNMSSSEANALELLELYEVTSFYV